MKPLHLPGRGVRHGMRAIHDWAELVDLLIDDVQAHLDRPFAIFGHSMGALIGIELAHRIRERYDVSPVWFGASACTAPSRRERELHWLTCPEDEFIDEVRSLDGMPNELLENREFMELVLPVLRADFHLCGSYVYAQREPLDCPMLALTGATDSICEDEASVAAWSRETTGEFQLMTLEAGHFFINSHRDEVIDLVSASLLRACAARASREGLLSQIAAT